MEHVLQDASDTELIQKILWIICCYVVSSFEQAPEGRAPPGWSGLPVQAAACAGEPSRRGRSPHLATWIRDFQLLVCTGQSSLRAIHLQIIVQWVQGS